MSRGLSIVGRKQKITDKDFYRTPDWVTEALLEHEVFEGSILEPCCGDGAMSEVIKKYNPYVHSSDIQNLGYGEVKDIFDYGENIVENIVTNPPFSIAHAVILQSLKMATNKVAMLLPLQFLESKSRYSLFTTTPLETVWVLCRRPTLYPANQPKPKNKGMRAYAWFVWNHSHTEVPALGWIY